MPIPSNAGQRVHLHWVRETPSRALACQMSIPNADIRSMPACVQNAVAATGLPELELHLPLYRGADEPGPVWFAGLQFRQDAPGRLIAEHGSSPDPIAAMGRHQALLLVARAISGDTTPLTIVAESAPAPILQPPPTRFRACSPGGGLAAAPAERTAGYDRTYKALSTRLQWAIRRTVPPAHVDSIEQFLDRPHMQSLLAWSAAAPVTGRSVDALALDIFNAGMRKRALKRMPSRLAPRLAEITRILGSHRLPPPVLAAYAPKRAARIAREARDGSRLLNLLFMNEFRIISAFVGFCIRIADWRDRAAGNPAVVYREVQSAWDNLEVVIRRFYQRRRHSALGSVLLLEAVCLLEDVD